MQKLPPLNALRYFLVAAKTLSFKQAAHELFVSQAAISQHIKTLESHLGVQLFVRGTRQVELSEHGKRLLPEIQAGFDCFHRGVSTLHQDNDPNVLNITVVESLSTRWLVPKLQDFHRLHPDIRVRLEPENRVRNFAGTDLDLAIRFGKGQYPQLESRLVLEDRYMLVCHPSLVNANLVLENLYTLPLLEETGPITGEAWQAFLLQFGLLESKFNKVLEVEDSTVTIVDAALAGQGIAMLRYNLIYQQLERKQLVQLFGFSHPSAYSYYLVAPKEHFNRTKVKLFERWLLHALSKIN